MSRSTEIHATGATAVVVQRATGADAARLRASAARLAGAAHPGVVQVLRSTGSDDSWEVQLAHAGRPIELVGPLTAEQVAGAVSAVAATLADLHGNGVVHGRIDGSHVLIGPHGRPVLCGFGPDDAGAQPADDVAALGALIVELLGTDGELEPLPDRRWHRRGSWTGWSRRSLLTIADQACAEPPTRRPSAARLAAAIAAAVPDAAAVDARTIEALEGPEEPGGAVVVDPLDALRPGPDDGPAGPARLPALLAAVLAVLVLGAGTVRWAQRGGAPVPQPRGGAATVPAPAPPVTTTAVPPDLPPTTTTRDRPSAPCAASSVPSPAGCQPVTIDGTTVLVGTRRYEVGQAGDRVVVGDWDCDGTPTPALLRPGSGEVFVFDAWATDADLVVAPVAHVADGELVAEAATDGCDVLVVRHPDGTRDPVARAGMA